MEKTAQILKFSKFLASVVVFLSFVICYLSFRIPQVIAVTPVPPPGRIPCSATQTDQNFSSDRPYQASPCGDSPKAVWCGNNLVIEEDVKGPTVPGNVPFVDVDITMPQKDYVVDLSNAQLPILGNTELTANSTNPTDQIDNATKMNEYVSWYLNGTNHTAEGTPSASTTVQGNSNIVDFSGPLNKLLPSAILDYQRIATLNSLQNTTYTPDTNGTTQPPATTEPANHNQIVVCATKQYYLGWLGQILGLVQSAVPKPCYTGNGNPASNEYRLNSWNGDVSFQRTFTNVVFQGLSIIVPGLGNLLNTAAGDAWNHKYPPVPWGNDQSGKPFADQVSFQKSYNEWRGDTCIVIPIIKFLICARNPTITNEYADLFQYIPLSNTVDKSAKNMIVAVPIQGEAGTVVVLPKIAYVINKEPVMYYPHTQEDSTLLDTLGGTYAPKGATPSAGTVSDNSVASNDGSQCQVVPVESNPGDNLFPEVQPSAADVTVNPYQVTRIPCHYVPPSTIWIYIDGVRTQETVGNYSVCEGTVAIQIQMVTKVPYANEIFNSSVAGPDSTFRKIYPKVDANAPVNCIADTPTVSSVTYTPDNQTNLVRVDTPAGHDKGNGSSAIQSQIFFPHFGSVYDYFLQGIQTALRPQGFANPTPLSGQNCFNVTCGDLPTGLPKASGSCSMGSTPFDVPQSLKDIISAASQTYNVPPGLILGVMFGEGAFNVDTSGHYNKYDWTDPNVKSWATCQPLPYCSAGASSINSVVPFDSSIWNTLAKEILPDLKKVDPTKTKADPCNLIDATYGLAKDLHDDAGGYNAAGKQCFGITMSSTIPTSCSWQSDQYETAIKEWETGGDPTCYTSLGSCLQGNSIPPCSTNSSDPNCDTAANHSSDPNVNSHNACVWDVATGGGAK